MGKNLFFIIIIIIITYFKFSLLKNIGYTCHLQITL